MIDKLEKIRDRYLQIEERLSDPEVVGDMKRFTQLNKEYRDLEPIVAALDAYLKVVEQIDFSKDVLRNEKDEELKEWAKSELQQLEVQKETMESEIKILLIPKDPEDEKNAVLEIRAGTGGDEACIFVGDLLRMYMRYCEKKGWKVELVSENPGSVDGYKEVVLDVWYRDWETDRKSTRLNSSH